MANKKSGSTPVNKVVYYPSSGQNSSTSGALVSELNKDIQLRMTRSNTITANVRIVYHGPNGNAVYGGSQWGQLLESILAQSIQDFLSRLRGQVSPEGFKVEPVGFHIDLKVHQPAIAASVLTFQLRK